MVVCSVVLLSLGFVIWPGQEGKNLSYHGETVKSKEEKLGHYFGLKIHV